MMRDYINSGDRTEIGIDKIIKAIKKDVYIFLLAQILIAILFLIALSHIGA